MRNLTQLLILMLLPASVFAADGDSWPKVITLERGELTVYQPQADSFADDLLEGRAAVSWVAAEGGAPIFGAVWLSMKVDINRETRMVHIRSLTVPTVRFPDADESDQRLLAQYLERELPNWDLPLELDRLIADLGLLNDPTTADLRHDPPKILFSPEPAVLVRIDGEPRLKTETSPNGATLERVLNTPFLIARLEGEGSFYLSGGGTLWYQAANPEGPYSVTASVPLAVSQLVQEETDGLTGPADGPPPKIFVATEPTELIVADGSPNWAPVEAVDELLYMTNTDSSVFLELSTQFYYTVLSGRWYRARQIEGEWKVEHVPNNELPTAFSEIKEGSAVGDVLSHVAGTEEAREAVLDNSIPQTAAVKRDDTSFEVKYDGEPKFEKIEGADGGVQSAVNTPKSVFKTGNRYFACEQGVWYESGKATGPWKVATEVPKEIYSIPTSSPHHNVTYVQVYDVTPQVVYVGYTPGYMGSYYYHGCVVYGTGWHYLPWYGPYYYPRPWTWGVGVHYNPWTGWSFGITFSNGPFRFTFGYGGYPGYYPRYYPGWWGPGGYRPYPRPVLYGGYTRVNINRNININTGDINIGSRPGVGVGNRPGTEGRPSTMPARNIYDRPENRNRLVERPATADRRVPAVARDRSNDLLTDRSGNVYRKDQNGNWNRRDQGQWKPAEGLDRAAPQPTLRPSTPGRPSQQPTTRPAQPTPRPLQPSVNQPRPSQPAVRPSQPTTRPSNPSIGRPSSGAVRPGLERDLSSRQRGAARSQGYSRPQSPRPAGGARPRRP